MYRRSFADTPPLRLVAAGTGGVLCNMAVFGGVNVIRGVYPTRTPFGGLGGVLGGHGVGRAYTSAYAAESGGVHYYPNIFKQN